MGTLASELGSIAGEMSAAPRVYSDANVPAGVVASMRHELGWDVLFVLEEPEWRRAPDRDHFVRALELGRTLVTLDQDFFDDRRFPADLSPGVIVCSAPDEIALLRILRHADRALLRMAGNPQMPLKGRKLQLTLDVVSHEAGS
jgi:Domain of unknown function (DUF5615)